MGAFFVYSSNVAEGVDYSFAHPSPSSLKTAGKTFALRYIGPGSAGKLLTASERDQLWAQDISIGFLAEGAAGDMLRGAALGKAHAQLAETHRMALGAPALPIYFAADVDMVAGNLPAITAYCNAAAGVLGRGRVGVYGEYDVMGWLKERGIATWFFQTYAWSAGKWFSGNHIEQYRNNQALGGGTVDLCRSKMDNFGQWVRPGSLQPGVDEMVMYVWCDGDLWGSTGAERFKVANPTQAEAIKRVWGEYGWAWKDNQVTPDELGGFGVVVPPPAGLPSSDAETLAMLEQLADGLEALAAAIRG
jgi:hypothetical protein